MREWFFAARELAYAANGWLRRVLALIQMGDKFDRGKTFAGTVGLISQPIQMLPTSNADLKSL